MSQPTSATRIAQSPRKPDSGHLDALAYHPFAEVGTGRAESSSGVIEASRSGVIGIVAVPLLGRRPVRRQAGAGAKLAHPFASPTDDRLRQDIVLDAHARPER